MKRFILYLFRWQLSTPILWIIVGRLGASLKSTIIANLIGGIIFFWIDKFIFTSQGIEMWHLKEGQCGDCKEYSNLYRLVVALNYDKRKDPNPVFLCYKCSKRKTDELRQRGYKIKGRSL
jgi:hypothetical protein